MRPLPESWSNVLAEALASPSFSELRAFVDHERTIHNVYPPDDLVFAAFERTPFASVKAVLLGQDPYHGPGQAEGLCLSVPAGMAMPPSLVNMVKELQADVGIPAPDNGSLAAWADQGLLLLNAVLTVREGAAGSHQGQGWETFTDAVIRALNARKEPVLFVLWGGYAKKKAKLVTGPQHTVLEGVHPSPLSAHKGFFGSRPFSKINEALSALGHAPIDWTIPDRGVTRQKRVRGGAPRPDAPAVGIPTSLEVDAKVKVLLASRAANLVRSLWPSGNGAFLVHPEGDSSLMVRDATRGLATVTTVPLPEDAQLPPSPQPKGDDEAPPGLRNGAVSDTGDRIALCTNDHLLLLAASRGQVLKSFSMFAEENESERSDEEDEDGEGEEPREWLGVPHAAQFDAQGKIVWLATVGEEASGWILALDAKTLAPRSEACFLEGIPEPAFIELTQRPGGGVILSVTCGQDGGGIYCAELKRGKVALVPPKRWQNNAFFAPSNVSPDGTTFAVTSYKTTSLFAWGKDEPVAETAVSGVFQSSVVGGHLLLSPQHGKEPKAVVLALPTLEKVGEVAVARPWDVTVPGGKLLSVGWSAAELDLEVWCLRGG